MVQRESDYLEKIGYYDEIEEMERLGMRTPDEHLEEDVKELYEGGMDLREIIDLIIELEDI